MGALISFACFQWSDKPCAPHLLQRDSYYVYTQQELKEKLYQEIISYFDKGKVSVGSSAVYEGTEDNDNSPAVHSGAGQPEEPQAQG